MNTIKATDNNIPQVIIIEQPLKKQRFRYECEKKFCNTIQGLSGKNSFPTIRLLNCSDALSIVVSCVTKDPPYKPHPHKLVNGNKFLSHGVCCFYIDANNKHDISFKNLSVQCVTKKNVEKSLLEREKVGVDPFKTGFSHKDNIDSIDLNSIRLCFQIFVKTEGRKIPLDPIVTEPICNKKSASDLKICWLSHKSASVAGGTQMCILCEKVSKTDIEVQFFHDESDWVAKGVFKCPKVFKQVAIVFETPAYSTITSCPKQIKEPIDVHIRLKRLSDGETSEPESFQLLPITTDSYDFNDQYSLKRKRKKCDGVSGEISKKLQNEITKDSNTINYNIFENLNNESWELPPMNVKIQPQMSQNLTMDNCMNVLSKTPVVRTVLTSQQNYNIPVPPLNLENEQDNLTDISNSDGWITCLLESINQDEPSMTMNNNFATENNVAHEPETDLLIPNLLPYNYDDTNNACNNDIHDLFTDVNPIYDNVSDNNIISELINDPNNENNNLNYSINSNINGTTVTMENNINFPMDSMQEFINILNDLYEKPESNDDFSNM